jgi:hypothetical protein
MIGSESLERIGRVFDLSASELGHVFGVGPEAAHKWPAAGVPAAHHEKFAVLVALCDRLEGKLQGDRIPVVTRRQADIYGGRSMLELIYEDEHRQVLASVRDSFEWSLPAQPLTQLDQCGAAMRRAGLPKRRGRRLGSR